MVSWFSIISGLAALQQTREDRKNPHRKFGLTHCLPLCVISLSFWPLRKRLCRFDFGVKLLIFEPHSKLFNSQSQHSPVWVYFGIELHNHLCCRWRNRLFTHSLTNLLGIKWKWNYCLFCLDPADLPQGLLEVCTPHFENPLSSSVCYSQTFKAL